MPSIITDLDISNNWSGKIITGAERTLLNKNSHDVAFLKNKADVNAVTVIDLKQQMPDKIEVSTINQANGVAGLNASSKLSTINLPAGEFGKTYSAIHSESTFSTTSSSVWEPTITLSTELEKGQHLFGLCFYWQHGSISTKFEGRLMVNGVEHRDYLAQEPQDTTNWHHEQFLSMLDINVAGTTTLTFEFKGSSWASTASAKHVSIFTRKTQ